MKDYEKLEELLMHFVGDDVVGYFERSISTSVQEVRVFTPVYRQATKSQDLVN